MPKPPTLPWLGVAIAVSMACAPLQASADTSLATAVKAAFISKFAPFVDWPASATRPTPFTICLVGGDPFGNALDASVAGLTYAGRPYQVVRVETIGPQSTCDIAYISGSSNQSVANALESVRGTPTLTITDEGAPQGIISFKMQAGKVRFRIDQTAATANSLTLSSKLLGLAISVKTSQGIMEQ